MAIHHFANHQFFNWAFSLLQLEAVVTSQVKEWKFYPVLLMVHYHFVHHQIIEQSCLFLSLRLNVQPSSIQLLWINLDNFHTPNHFLSLQFGLCCDFWQSKCSYIDYISLPNRFKFSFGSFFSSTQPQFDNLSFLLFPLMIWSLLKCSHPKFDRCCFDRCKIN